MKKSFDYLINKNGKRLLLMEKYCRLWFYILFKLLLNFEFLYNLNVWCWRRIECGVSNSIFVNESAAAKIWPKCPNGDLKFVILSSVRIYDRFPLTKSGFFNYYIQTSCYSYPDGIQRKNCQKFGHR